MPSRFERLKTVLDRRQPDLTTAMEDVHKGRNFSALLRTADAVGVLRAHATAYERDRPYLGISAGAGKWVRVRRHASTVDMIQHLRERGFRILGADPAPEAVDFREVDYTLPTALLVGNELEGLSGDGRGGADLLVGVPMRGFVRSLNVSVAAGLILYEAERQRQAAGMYDACRIEEDEYRRLLFEWMHPKLARHCRRRGVAYPEMDEEGVVVGEVPR